MNHIGASMSPSPANGSKPLVHNTFWPYLPKYCADGIEILSVSVDSYVAYEFMFCRLPWVPDAEHEALPDCAHPWPLIAVVQGTCTSLCTSNAVADKSMLASARISCIHN
jgi:hypothetical protein